MSRGRIIRVAAAGLLAIVLLAIVSVALVLRSNWFHEKLRAKIVDTVETATGGRAELSGFRFDWRRLRAEALGFALHGKEPADKPPLFRASSIAVGLKVASVWKRNVDIQSLDVNDPRVYLIIYPDGSTNVPAPKVKGNGNTLEDILNLAIGRFQLANGVFEVESRGKTPFDAQGQNLTVQFSYERAGPRYRGSVGIHPLNLQIEDKAVVPFAVDVAAILEKNRIAVSDAKIATGGTSIEFSGALEDLNAPRATFQYDARVGLPDVARIFDVPELRRGEARVGGNGSLGQSGLTATGNLRASGVEFRDSNILLRYGHLEGAVQTVPGGIDVTGVKIGATYFSSRGNAPAEGTIRQIALRDRLLELRGVSLEAMGGGFEGQARLRDWKLYSVAGDVANFGARKIVALYSPAPLPWDGLGSGPVQIEGSLKDKNALRVAGTLAISPAPGSGPVNGQVNARYEARSKTLDLARSTLTLPSSRAEFNGVYGRELDAHLESRDLNDLLPLLGQSADELFLKLKAGGSAVFDGKVRGELDDPHFDGRLAVKSFTVVGHPIDSLDADVTASPENVHLQKAVGRYRELEARFDAQIALHDFKQDDASEVFGKLSIEKGPVGDLYSILDLKDVPISGALGGGLQLTGTYGSPIFKGNVTIANGKLRDEPVDQFEGSIAYANHTAELIGGRVTAGSKQADLALAYHLGPNGFDSGRLHFDVKSNVMPLADIVMLQQYRPGAKGTAQVSANGDLDIANDVRVAALHGDLTARGLQLSGQQFGDAHLTADSQGQSLRTRLEANFANSNIRGDGTWRLEGDYPGTAEVTFSRLDFGQLRAWIAPSDAREQFAGFAEGEMRLEGPALKPDAMRAEIRLPKIEIGPAAGSGAPQGLALHNAAPIVATLTNSVLTVQDARLQGRNTDVTIGGRIVLNNDRSPLDLRVGGRVDLALAQEFNSDFLSSGLLVIDAGVRGAIDSPLVNGRMQVLNASLNIVDFPNGISNANGTVLFSGSRASIEKLSGETGGGKVDLSGFITFQGEDLVFQLQAAARQVRVRYPEGVSTVANADLRLVGTSDRSTLGGTITILRTGFNPQSDFSSVIAKSAEPVRTPPARTGIIGGVNFDVQIETAPDIQFQSSLTQDIQVEANLRLRGNASNPALLGRVNITHGQIVFYGTKYTVNQGSISFYNPLKIEPIFDVDLETKARGIDITLTVSGPLNKLNLTPRSDPPLQFNEIVALLATGRSPTSDPTLLAQQATAPQSWQQMGASALLGQAIASPVAGRLQRFFGVSKLRIDPTLPGVENNPQARLTVEQQVTPDITFTYITNVTSSNPQVVRVEWAFSRQWSVVALREENGVFSLDFFYKKRF